MRRHHYGWENGRFRERRSSPRRVFPPPNPRDDPFDPTLQHLFLPTVDDPRPCISDRLCCNEQGLETRSSLPVRSSGTRARRIDSVAFDPCTFLKTHAAVRVRVPRRGRGRARSCGMVAHITDALTSNPRTLVSSGAHAFARRNKIETVEPTNMISPRAKEDWERWIARYDEVGSTEERDAGTLVFPRDVMQDTVGAIAWDSEGNLAAGVSRFADRRCLRRTMLMTCDSGGLLLKYSGRIGEVMSSFRGMSVGLLTDC